MKQIVILMGLVTLGVLLFFTPRSTSVQDPKIEGTAAPETSPADKGRKHQKKLKADETSSMNSVASTNEKTQGGGVTTFADFRIRVEPKEDELDVKGTFTLGPASNGINLLKEPTSIKVGTLSVNIPAGGFKQGNRSKIEFQKLIECRYWDLFIRAAGNNAFEFHMEVQGAKESAKLKAEDVTVSIGDDSGSGKPAS